MSIHVLPGDSLAAEFNKTGINGEVVVCRECLVAGDKSGATLEEFWERRANFIALDYGGDPIEYQENVAYELEKLIGLPADTEVNLWFEYELFCQVNMWFCLDLVMGSDAEVFRVEPLNASPDDIWKGFGPSGAADLVNCFEARTRFSDEDIRMGSRLWHAFREGDLDELRRLGEYRSPCFPFLKEVCEAAAEIGSRPAAIVRELKARGLNELDSLFPEFQKRAGVYGYGDLQVERLLQLC
ncbi:MAG: DUF1835 domain-containing protein [Acidobacteria bacterium]|nr:DUF1835 domain-containing protein [Acidobacteriota bacterium]